MKPKAPKKKDLDVFKVCLESEDGIIDIHFTEDSYLGKEYNFVLINKEKHEAEKSKEERH